jgi:hypothetical protein
MFKRFLPVAGVLGLVSAAMASTASAGGGGGYGGPGLFTYNDKTASASFYDSASLTATNIYVNRGQQSFKVSRTPGGPVIESFGTVLMVDQFGPTFENSGCWVIPDSDFSIANDLSSASLNAPAADETACPGYYVGSSTGGKPGLQSSIGYGGGGGGGGGGAIPVPVRVSWAGNGAKWTNTNSGTSHCGSYNDSFHGSFDYEFGTASGSVGSLSGQRDPFAQVAQDSSTTNSNAAPSGACNPYGF